MHGVEESDLPTTASAFLAATKVDAFLQQQEGGRALTVDLDAADEEDRLTGGLVGCLVGTTATKAATAAIRAAFETGAATSIRDRPASLPITLPR